jgi:hypothetical protein
MIETNLNRMTRELKRLQRVRPTVFGSGEHGFVLNRRLSESALREFEHRHRVDLPAGYRAFIGNIANGGVGPGCGVFRLGEMDHNAELQPWAEGDGFIGVLANPFPYMKPWNDLSEQPSPELMKVDEIAYEAQMALFEERYFAPVDGAVPVSHLGCAIRVWLVVSGPEAGNLWLDDRASDGGWEPVTLGTLERVTFLPWYENWVRGALLGEDVF